MGGAVYVFTASAEDDVAFSLLKDGSNLPPPRSGEPWEIFFQAEFTEPAISMFRVTSGTAYEALCSNGLYVGPIAPDWHHRRGF